MGAYNNFFPFITFSLYPKPSFLMNLLDGLDPGLIGNSFFKISSEDFVRIIWGLW